jgi:hypothetical protein
MLASSGRRQAMFKHILAVIGIGLLGVLVAVAQTVPAQQVIVSKGTALAVTTLQPLSSTTARTGDDVPLRLSRPLVVNGVTLLREDELLHGRVTHVQRAGPKCRYGTVQWKIDRISFTDHSSAHARLYVNAPWSRRPVPDQLPLGTDKSVADRLIISTIAAPIIALALVVESPRLVMHDSRNDGCGAGKDYLLPANSTLAVVITKDHHVRF